MSASRFNDLEQQLAHLRWRRWQNERNIRDKLTIGKSMREKVSVHVHLMCALQMQSVGLIDSGSHLHPPINCP
jgi:hypothetical protein